MTSDAEFIAAFCEVTNSSEEVARYYIVVRRYRDFQQAIDRYFEDGMSPDLTPSQRQELERALNQTSNGGPTPPPSSDQTHNTPPPSGGNDLPSGSLPSPVLQVQTTSRPPANDEATSTSSSSSSLADLMAAIGDVDDEEVRAEFARLMGELAGLGNESESSSSTSSDDSSSSISLPPPKRDSPDNWNGAPLRLPVFTKPERTADMARDRTVKVPARKKQGVTMRLVVFQDGIEYDNKFYKNDTSEAQKVLKGVESGLLEIGGPDVVDVCVVDRRDTKYSK